MENVITYENLRSFAYSNDHLCTGPIRGVVLQFYGLGGQAMFSEDFDHARELAEKGILLVFPYCDPWCWMNPRAVRYTDEVVGVLLRHYDLPDTTPIVSAGSSMGGLSALVYTRYAARTPVACVASCPVCDLPYHYTERPDLPRTLYAAFGDADAPTLMAALRTASPLHLAPELPDIPYEIFHCGADTAVNINRHSERLVAELRRCGRRVNYHVIPDRDHGDLGEDGVREYQDCMVRGILKCEN